MPLNYYAILLLLHLTACNQSPAKENTASVNEKSSGQPEAAVLPKENPSSEKKDTAVVKEKADPLHPSISPNGDKGFAVFLNQFKKALTTHHMQSIAPFTQFPFDEDGGSWTREQFIKSFQLEKKELALLQKAVPEKISAKEYRLFGEEVGLIFKTNKAGEWKWVSIHYAH